jgi:hypothetical protein
MNAFVVKISVSKNHKEIALAKIAHKCLASLAQTDNSNRLNGSINVLGANKSQVIR